MPASSDSPTARNPSTTRTCSASCNPANQSPSQLSRPPLPSFALISFKRLSCGLFFIHSIRFDLIVLTVAVRDGSQFADVRHDDLTAEPLPLLAGPDRNTFPPPLRRVPEASVKPGQPISRHLAQGFVANSEVVTRDGLRPIKEFRNSLGQGAQRSMERRHSWTLADIPVLKYERWIPTGLFSK
jgi:hypothetical protein